MTKPDSPTNYIAKFSVLIQFTGNEQVFCVLTYMRKRKIGLNSNLYFMQYMNKQGKSEGFDSCDRPSTLTQIGLKSSDFSAHVTLKFDGWPRKIMGHLF